MDSKTVTRDATAQLPLAQKLTAGVVRKAAPLVTAGLAIGGVGTYLGAGITNVWAQVALMLLFFAGVFVVPWQIRKSRNRGLTALGIWSLVAGLFIGPAIHEYTKVLGWEVVFQCYMGTAAVMLGTWVYAMLSKYDFSKWFGFLFLALWGLIMVGIVNIFVAFSGVTNTVYSLLGMLIFVGFFLFDFNRAKKLEDTWPNAVDVAMALILNFYNFLLFFLRLRGGDRR